MIYNQILHKITAAREPYININLQMITGHMINSSVHFSTNLVPNKRTKINFHGRLHIL